MRFLLLVLNWYAFFCLLTYVIDNKPDHGVYFAHNVDIVHWSKRRRTARVTRECILSRLDHNYHRLFLMGNSRSGSGDHEHGF